MDKATFIETLLAEVGEARMLQPGAAGEWSVKDVIAHVMWGEREMVGVMQAHALVGSNLWDLPEDERNAAVFTEQRDCPLQEVLTEEQQVYAQFLEAVQALSDEDFSDPHRFREMPEQWLPWQILAGCSFAHYRQHMQSIRAWLSSMA
jgi:hypothetical protein